MTLREEFEKVGLDYEQTIREIDSVNIGGGEGESIVETVGRIEDPSFISPHGLYDLQIQS